jgi:hypothetical protein
VEGCLGGVVLERRRVVLLLGLVVAGRSGRWGGEEGWGEESDEVVVDSCPYSSHLDRIEA